MIRKETQIELHIHTEDPHRAIEYLSSALNDLEHDFAARGEGYIEIKFSTATIEETKEKPKE